MHMRSICVRLWKVHVPTSHQLGLRCRGLRGCRRYTLLAMPFRLCYAFFNASFPSSWCLVIAAFGKRLLLWYHRGNCVVSAGQVVHPHAPESNAPTRGVGRT